MKSTSSVTSRHAPEAQLAVISDAVATILAALGEDTSRPGLAETPTRVAATLRELFGGVGVDASQPLRSTFPAQSNDLIAVSCIPISSLCEHHLLPFRGLAHVAYMPSDLVTGFSKFEQSLSILAARPQLQENVTREFAEAIDASLTPRGVLVVLECEHDCVAMRGQRTRGVISSTSYGLGELATGVLRAEALAMFRGGSRGPDDVGRR